MKRMLPVLLVVCMLVALAGITAFAANGEIVVGLGEEPETLDPDKTNRFHSYVVLSHMVEPLFTLDKEYKVIPLLAESYDWAADGLTMKVNLKKGIKFHDGSEMTAEDVKASYERYFALSPLASYLPEKAGGIYKIDTPDKYTVIFHFKGPKPLALYHMADAHVAIMPKKWLDANTDDDIGITTLVGTGPLKLVEWIPSDRIVMERFEDYNHGPAFVSNQGPSNAKRMIFRIIPEDSTLTAELMAGNVDISFDVAPSSVKVLERNKNVRVETAPTYSVQYLAMNMQKEVIQDKKVRMAIAHAINKDNIAKAAWFGVGKPIAGLINQATIGYWPGVKELEYKFNLDTAKKLLDEAGWKDSNGDGVRDKDGKPLALTLITFSNIDQWRIAGEIVQAQLKAVGIDVKLETAEVGATYDRAETGDYDIGIFRNTWWLGQPYLRFLTHGNNVGASNYGQWANPDIDRNLEIAGNDMSLDKRTQALNEVQRIIVESAVWVPLVANTSILAAKANVEGIDELTTHPWWPPLMRALLLDK